MRVHCSPGRISGSLAEIALAMSAEMFSWVEDFGSKPTGFNRVLARHYYWKDYPKNNLAGGRAKIMSRFFNRLSHIIFPGIVLVHAVLFIIYWLTNSLFYSETNDYLMKMLGTRRDYISLCLLISALICLWSAARLVIFRIRFKHRLASLAAWLYGALALIYIAFFYGSFWLLLRESPVQLQRIGQMLLYYRLVLDPFLLLGAALLAGLWVNRSLLRRKTAGKKVDFLPSLLLVLVIIILWALPVAYPPDSVFRGTLPAKPLIIAHRGASMLAPENTLASANLAADLGVYGLETDIHISRDGIPFLMHDDTLGRTTDVATLYPDRARDRAEYFTLAEVTRLNAGKWFVEQDPYKTIAGGRVSAGQIEEYTHQTVPTLADELQIVRKNKLAFIFDLKQPPDDQPYARSFFNLCLSQIQAAGIDAQVWFLVDQAQLEAIRLTAPAMKPAYGVDFRTPPSAGDLKASGYQIVNAEYGLSKDWIRNYQGANLWVNLYTIDEPWQYSRLWLLGVNSTTTSNTQSMIGLSRPILSLPFRQYVVLWSGVGILGLALVLGLTIPVYYRRGSPES
jgi:glycerophosphoryl diester phosphodiesterase